MKTVVSNEYLELVRRCQLRPIRSVRDLHKATAVIDELIAKERRSRDADDYLDVLSDLVKKYEDAHHPIPDARPAEMLAFFMEQRGVNQRAVALGSGVAVSSISEILAGRRNMTLEQMQKLGRFFHVSAALFMPEGENRAASKASAGDTATSERRR